MFKDMFDICLFTLTEKQRSNDEAQEEFWGQPAKVLTHLKSPNIAQSRLESVGEPTLGKLY